MDYKIDDNKNNVDNSQDIIYIIKNNKKVACIVVFAVLLVIIGLIGLKYDVKNLPAYYFGLVFFIAGLCIGLFVRGMGIPFLFTHGAAGLSFMLVGQINYILNNPIVSDLGFNVYVLIGIAVILAVIGFILTIIYNICSHLKDNRYYLYVLLGCFLISISIIQLVPLLYNLV